MISGIIYTTGFTAVNSTAVGNLVVDRRHTLHGIMEAQTATLLLGSVTCLDNLRISIQRHKNTFINNKIK